MAHSESSVHHFEAINKLAYKLSFKSVHSVCEMIELAGEFKQIETS